MLTSSQLRVRSKLEHDGDTGIMSAPEAGLPRSAHLGSARLDRGAPTELVTQCGFWHVREGGSREGWHVSWWIMRRSSVS